MANQHTTLTSLFSGIANGIRERNDISDSLLADNFPALVGGMKGGIYNHIPYSTDANGAIYNKVGWKTGYRLNSSGAEVAEAGYEVTGFIPAKMGDIIRLKNVYFKTTESACYICLYDSNKTNVYNVTANAITSNGWFNATTETLSSGELNYTKLELVDATGNATLKGYLERTAYIRFSFSMCDSNSIITINEGVDLAPRPIEKLYKTHPLNKQGRLPGTEFAFGPDHSITCSHILEYPIIFSLASKAFTVSVNGISKTAATVSSSSSYVFIDRIIKINSRQFIIMYWYDGGTTDYASPTYARLFTVTENNLIQSAAITISAEVAGGNSYNLELVRIFEIVNDNNRAIEFGFCKEKEVVSKGEQKSLTYYFNGMYLNGISALSLFSTAWTSLVTATTSAGTQSVYFGVIGEGIKYGFSYYKETASGFTGGFVHRIRGRNGVLKKQIFRNINGTTTDGAKGDNDSLVSSRGFHTSLIGMLNDGSYLGIYCYGNNLTDDLLEFRIYDYNIYDNVFTNKSTLTINGASLLNECEDFYKNTYYFNNNIIGIFSNITNKVHLYQIIKNNNNYSLYSIGNINYEVYSGEKISLGGFQGVMHRCITESSGPYGNSFYNIGDTIYKKF